MPPGHRGDMLGLQERKEVSVRTRCAVLLTALAALLAALVLASAAGANVPIPGFDSGYVWQQPTTVAPATAPTVPSGPWAVSSYPWVQPWEARGELTPDVGRWTQPPASVPLG